MMRVGRATPAHPKQRNGNKMEEQEMDWNSARESLTKSMVGFEGLIDVIQGMLIGEAVAMQRIWITVDNKHTLEIVREVLADLNVMTSAWGYEK